MKKRLYAIFACIVFSALIFSGCGNTNKNLPNTDTSISGEDFTSEEGLPLLETDLQQLYKDAEAIYLNIVFGNFHCDTTQKIERDNYIYYKVDEPEYDSFDSFKVYLSNYFTQDFINREILSPDSIRFMKADNGDLYMMDASRGANIFYAGHVFHKSVSNENQITFTATAYYSNTQEAYDGERFYVEPENSGDFSTQEFTFALVKEEENWKFDQFTCFF
ncbi:DL-endopeptidase inhibitor IseA family protein [Anaerotignum sp.]|uniref:DL-endopeptidase inhibitor IseA family protein n=1 Tax=Anaerotignum sp. TaxID=2039241 RepID=UPI0028AC882A|nr:DL-endopeptidase inhibitor IseA family protein [Anaerotignum sp.]